MKTEAIRALRRANRDCQRVEVGSSICGLYIGVGAPRC